MKSTKSIKRNYIYNLSYQVMTYLIPVITTPYLSRVLGAKGIGTYSFAESVVSYFVLFCNMGINVYGQREISYVQNDIEARSKVFWETKALSLITFLVTSLAYLSVFKFFKEWSIYIILFMNIVSVVTDISWFYRGIEEFGKVVIRNAIVKLLGLIYIFAFVKTEDDLLIYIFGVVFFQLLGNLSMWVYLPKYVKKPEIKTIRPFSILPIAISLFIPEVAIAIYTILDKTMIGFIVKDYAENGYYEQAMKITKMLMAAITSFGAVLAPRIGSIISKGEEDRAKEYIYINYRFVFAVGLPLSMGLFFISPRFVPLFLGAGYDEASSLLRILSWLIVIICISNVTGMQYLVITKRQRILTVTVIVGAVTNLILNMFLIIGFKARGAAAASVISELAVMVSQFAFVHKEISVLRVIREGIPFLISGAIMLVVLHYCDMYFGNGVWWCFLLVIIGSAVYGIETLTLYKIGLIKHVS
ncbi:MAG: flippase [Butyrivibrio sp.]|jgi:O-antigen/teichoic acid export membrane protein|uniref:flippase n=1 Tax=Butyrivibrio sp. TaxID=28121 RepID=UPI001ED5FD55|nr:flippase [Butyrivibrio sp.]MBE5840871.1 flippase [Butyrivibrio sp.]